MGKDEERAHCQSRAQWFSRELWLAGDTVAASQICAFLMEERAAARKEALVTILAKLEDPALRKQYVMGGPRAWIMTLSEYIRSLLEDE